MKKNSLLTGIKSLLTNYQWSKLHEYESKKLKQSNAELNKYKKNLKKGPKVGTKNIIRNAKKNKGVLLQEAGRLKKINPDINRKKLAYELAIFSMNLPENGLTKSYSNGYIYKEILK